jgi:hypothetical protein
VPMCALRCGSDVVAMMAVMCFGACEVGDKRYCYYWRFLVVER